MPITLNGTTGVVTPGATVGSITGILKASSGVVSRDVTNTPLDGTTLEEIKSVWPEILN